MFDPDKGTVMLDHQNVADCKIESVRKAISIVPQNGILFNDTILNNIKYSNPDATMEQVYDVVRRCQLYDFIEVCLIIRICPTNMILM